MEATEDLKHPTDDAFARVLGYENDLRDLQAHAHEVWDRRIFSAAANALGRVRRSYMAIDAVAEAGK